VRAVLHVNHRLCSLLQIRSTQRVQCVCPWLIHPVHSPSRTRFRFVPIVSIVKQLSVRRFRLFSIIPIVSDRNIIHIRSLVTRKKIKSRCALLRQRGLRRGLSAQSAHLARAAPASGSISRAPTRRRSGVECPQGFPRLARLAQAESLSGL
jgi:hypothetical protein